jgi:hypothetical protein
MKKKEFFFIGILLFAGLSLAIAGTVGTNISPSGNARWAWNDAIGWIDFYTSNNVVVSATGIMGYASSSVGRISFDCTTPPSGGSVCGTSNYHVTNDSNGNLSGWAWNDAIGWISMCGNSSGGSVLSGSAWVCPSSPTYQVTIDANGNFQGYAWSDAIGWIDFNCDNDNSCSPPSGSNFYVGSLWVATGTIGTLDSITYDTGVVGGAQFNSIEWQGASGGVGTSVQFQLAVSNTSSGPWNFVGNDGTSGTYYKPSGPGVALSLTPVPSASPTLFTNYRYFRYRVTLVATPTSTPRVDNVIVNWSP